MNAEASSRSGRPAKWMGECVRSSLSKDKKKKDKTKIKKQNKTRAKIKTVRQGPTSKENAKSTSEMTRERDETTGPKTKASAGKETRARRNEEAEGTYGRGKKN